MERRVRSSGTGPRVYLPGGTGRAVRDARRAFKAIEAAERAHRAVCPCCQDVRARVLGARGSVADLSGLDVCPIEGALSGAWQGTYRFLQAVEWLLGLAEEAPYWVRQEHREEV